MKITLIGFGGMGRAVHRYCVERGHEVTHIIDPSAAQANAQISSEFHKEFTLEQAQNVDLVIDCSLGEFVLPHAQICARAQNADSKNQGPKFLIVATGWYEQLPELQRLADENPDFGLLWSSNFSIGVNLFFRMVEKAAQLANSFEEYDIWAHEIHHSRKADSPSGTAKTLEDILLKNIERKTHIVEDKLDRPREDHEIHFSSVRGGLVNFGHTIAFDSPADTITLSHSARSRDGYALGAVQAAEWLVDKKGLHTMEDFLADLL
jgi:4-hydroxy-tetrahydrodipicolinate reductase